MKLNKFILLSLILLNTIAFSQKNVKDYKNTDESILARADSTEKEGWTRKGNVGLNFSQVSLSNWAAGGKSSMSGLALFGIEENYKKNKSAWDNTLLLRYGMISQNNAPFFKNEDVVDFTSKYGHQFKRNKNWYYGGLINLLSQLTDGYENEFSKIAISRLFSPAYITLSIGLDYKPAPAFSLFISPITSKNTVVIDSNLTARYGVETGKKIRSEIGGMIALKVQKDIMKNINLMSKASFFSNYLENPQNIDILWDVIINMKVNKYISASITTSLIYDHDIEIGIDNNKDEIIDYTAPRTQFKEAIAIGLVYNF